jgi:hypothetical protein
MLDILVEPCAAADEPVGAELAIGLHAGLPIEKAYFDHPRFWD